MPISKINTGAIHTDAITNAKLADDVVGNDELAPNIELTGEYLKVPVGNTAQRPGTPSDGMLRFNTDFNKLEQYSSSTSTWSAIDTPPSITSLSYPNSLTAVDPAGGETITLTGTNFSSDVIVSIDGTDCTTTYIDSTSITFVTPTKTAGDYDVVATNGNGLSATLTSGITFNGVPAFTSPAAGKIGDSLKSNTTISTITIVAAEPDSGTLAYSITSGSLPTGLSLNSSSGEITGTTPSETGTTNYPFTITATDDENQTNTRNYSLTVLRPVYNYTIQNSYSTGNAVGNGYLAKTLSGTHTTYTVSMWVKMGAYQSSGDTQQYVWSNSANIGLMSSKGSSGRVPWTWYLYDQNAGGFAATPDVGWYDTTGWQHVVWSVNAGTGTLYVNGVADQQQAGTTGHGSLTAAFMWGTYHSAQSTYNFRGQMTHCALVTGQALTPSSFGADYNGIWIPKDLSSLNFGTDGCWLKFEDASNFGRDYSGNGNDFAVTSISGTANNADNQTLDTPTNNICAVNGFSYDNWQSSSFPDDGYYLGSYYINGNYTNSLGTHALKTGKWYWEFQVGNQTGGGNFGFGGIITSDFYRYNYIRNNLALYASARSWGVQVNNYSTDYYNIYDNGTGAGNVNVTTQDITFQIALDLDNGKMWIGRAGTWLGSGSPDPATGTDAPINIFDTVTDGTGIHEDMLYIPVFQTTRSSDQSNGANISANFGRYAFDHTPPSGFNVISSANMTDSMLALDIADYELGTKFEDSFDVVTYTGSGSGTVVPQNFEPDLLWIKYRNSGSYGARVFARTQMSGTSMLPLYYHSNNEVLSTYANSDSITATSSSSFTTGRVDAGGSGDASGGIDTSSGEYVAMSWKLGGDAVSNPDGNLSSTISANPDIGASVVRYTGNGTSGQTIGHGLGGLPDVIISKQTNGTFNWWVWTRFDTDTNGGAGFLSGMNNINALDGSLTTFAGVDNTVLTLPTTDYGNGNGEDYFLQCFRSITGFSKFGYYEANSSGEENGPTIYCGFKPKLVLVKRRGSTGNWLVWTEPQEPQGINQRPWYTNLTNTDGTEATRDIAMTSTGFKIMGDNTDVNGTAGEKYFFMAFGEGNTKFPIVGY